VVLVELYLGMHALFASTENSAPPNVTRFKEMFLCAGCMRNVMFQVGGLLCSMDTWNAVDDFNIDSTICRKDLNGSNRTPYLTI